MISHITLAPLISLPLLLILILLGLALIGLSLWQRARGVTLRLVGFGVLVLILLNPRIIQERHAVQPDIVIAVC